MGCVMSEEQTTVAVRRYLDELAGDSPSEPVIRALLDRAVRRLHQPCGTLPYRSYPRLTRPPLNLQTNEMLGAVVEWLLKALREARPATERECFGLAWQHMRWELNDLARRLDEQPAAVENLPEAEREAFDMVRIQGMTQVEVARVIGVSVVTVKRRLSRGLQLLAASLEELRPPDGEPDAS
jgi:RNA polymerase sigma-70 factor (ECF subfamily)